MDKWVKRMWGFPDGVSGKEPACQCRRCKRCEFDPWVWKIPWNRKWQPSPVLSPGKFRGQRSLVSYSPWGHRELDLTGRLNTSRNTQRNIIKPQEMIWRREWQPTPVSLPGESHGQRSLVGYSPWGHKELDTTERLTRLLQEMGDILAFVTAHVSTFAKQGKSDREREVLHDIPYI